ncbi:MAG: GTPase domain-containing protein [Synergistaceae bacterium]|nr:GTPase domain-containing protein [Synergistaceae bacterium]
MQENYSPYENLETANIIIAGVTGSGKSTLINNVFSFEDKKKALTAVGGNRGTVRIDVYKKEGVPVKIWDTVGLEMKKEITDQTIAEMKKVIANPKNNIHVIWYCINILSSRYQEAEADFVKSLYDKNLPFIIVLTQCVKSKKQIDAFEATVRETNEKNGMPGIEIVQVLSESYSFENPLTEETLTVPAFGLDELVNITREKLPEYAQRGLIAAMAIRRDNAKVAIKMKTEEAHKILLSYIKKENKGWNWWVNKVPIVNVFTTNSSISRMIRDIAKVYNKDISSLDVDAIFREMWGWKRQGEAVFRTLIPFVDFGTSTMLNKMMLKGEAQKYTEAEIEQFSSTDQAVATIALFGECFIQAAERILIEAVDEALKNSESEITVNTEINLNKLVGKMKEFIRELKEDLRKKKEGVQANA